MPVIRDEPLAHGHLKAGGRGFEPRLTDSESAVLPLDEPPKQMAFYHRRFGWSTHARD